jgi:hypothetical protein
VIDLGTIDAETVAKVTAAPDHENCDLIKNCSVAIKPPQDWALLVSPQSLEIDHSVGSLTVFVDGNEVWHWTETQDFNRSKVGTAFSVEDGYILVKFNHEKVATTWRHAKFELIFTAFIPLTPGESCPQPFYYDCGNRRCIREALRCDGVNNCGHSEEEDRCGMDTVSIIVLTTFGTFCIAFCAMVFYLTSRSDDDTGVVSSTWVKPKIKISNAVVYSSVV